MRDVTVYSWPEQNRSRLIGAAMAEGIRRAGLKATEMEGRRYRRGQTRIAVFYGFKPPLTRAFEWQRDIGGRAVYVDLGYFGRHHGGRWSGFHKLSVGARHPTAYFQARRHDPERVRMHNIAIAPWRKRGTHVLIAGMGPKAARAAGLGYLAWERQAVAALRGLTDRPILYRPKPSDSRVAPLPGTRYSPPSQPLEAALKDCWCVVTHHSNVAVDAILAGVPAIVFDGVAVPMGAQDFAAVQDPPKPDGRETWLADIAWTQFSIAEMRSGFAWRHLVEEGLV